MNTAETHPPAPWAAYAAELAGTFLMVAWGLSAVVFMMSAASPMARLVPSARLRLLATGFLFAAGGTAVVYSPLGQRSGGHINPAISVNFCILGKMRGPDMILYAAAQCAGAIAGAGLVKLLWGAWARSVEAGVTRPAPWLSPAGAAAVELVITASLVGVILVFLSRPRLHRWTGLAAGIWVALLVFAEAPVTGASLNPARSLGPALVTGDCRDLWVYFAGPLAGAGLAAFLWKRAGARRHPVCAKLFHTHRYPCHLADCRFGASRAGAEPPVPKEVPR